MVCRFSPLFLLAALLTFGVPTACAPSTPTWHGTPYDPPRSAPDFDLNAMDGTPTHLGSFAGRPLLLYFGYTSCPDFCPTTLADLTWVFDELGDSAQEVRVLFVTVDLGRDSDERLTSYLGRFNPDFLGGRPEDEAALQSMLDAFDAYAQPDPPISHAHANSAEQPVSFTHSARVFLIDGDGRLVTNYAFGTPREEILADLRRAIEIGE